MSTTPAHTALLVMDYQPAILALLPESDSEALLGRMEKVIADVLAAAVDVLDRTPWPVTLFRR
jgi:nicotinamidase-related amidase